MNTDDLQKEPIKEKEGNDEKQIKLTKTGKVRKELSDEDKAKRSAILAEGRRKAQEKRKQLADMKKNNQPTIKPIPEPEKNETKYEEKKIEQDVESEPETVKIISKPKKSKKKKVIVIDESSSSEEEVIVKKKKKKPSPSPPPPPEPPQAPIALKPSIPQPSEEEIEKLRKDKIKKYQERIKRDKLMSNIFG